VVLLTQSPELAVASDAASTGSTDAVTLWHSYRGAEEDALIQVVDDFERDHPSHPIELLAVPYEVMASKLTTTIPRGNGPDVFIFAHERIGGWARAGLLASLDETVSAGELDRFLPATLPPLRFEGSLYGLPLAFKSIALFRNEALVPRAPLTTDELLTRARQLSASGRFGLAYPTDSFYFHAPWFFGFGGRLFATQDPVDFASPAFAASLNFVDQLQRDRLVPEEATTALVAQLFNKSQVGMVISGPWFVGEIDAGVSYSVSPLPVVSETGLPASPLLTDEAVFVSRQARSPATALLLAKHLASDASALIRARVGRQVVANTATWADPQLAKDPVLGAFRRQLATATPMDNRPAMRDVWEPAQLALKKVLRGSTEISGAVGAAQARYRAITRPVPARSQPGPYLVFVALAALAFCGLVLRWLAAVRRAGQLRTAAQAWAWVGPASIATSVLVFLPFLVGLVIAFFAHREGEWTFVGLANFRDILASAQHQLLEPLSFYYALLVTLAWTVLNVALHLGIGLALALLLNRPSMRLRPLYRVLLILPWAVPNYITALIWKGLFHRQLGAVNGVLEWLGLEGVAWFSSFGTAFFANLCTNVWLGFPFMMVVCLGALQSIPSELYEAADVDGASWLSKLQHITLPLLRPALVPAVLLGTVWTFNQFNIVYLVSGGEPDGATEILISEAYRWAFTRREQYGYAAAYAVLIFLVLLGWSLLSARIARRAEGVA